MIFSSIAILFSPHYFAAPHFEDRCHTAPPEDSYHRFLRFAAPDISSAAIFFAFSAALPDFAFIFYVGRHADATLNFQLRYFCSHSIFASRHAFYCFAFSSSSDFQSRCRR